MADTPNEETPLLNLEEEQHVRFEGEMEGLNGDQLQHNNENAAVDIEIGGETSSDFVQVGNEDELGGGEDGKKNGKKTKKKKKKKVKLNYRTALALETQVRMNLIKHSLAADYFTWQQYWKFTFPQAVFTALSSTLAFSASADMFKNHAETINITVGFISAMVVLIQTISGIRIFGTRADRHRNVAVQLRDLADDISLMKFKLNMVEEHEKEHAKSLRQSELDKDLSPMGRRRASIYSFTCDDDHEDEEDSDDDDDDEEVTAADTFDGIQKRYQQSLSGCSSNVPLELSEAFQGLASNLDIADTKHNIEQLHNIYGHINYRAALKAKAFDILAAEILNDFFFPAALPDSKRMVKQAMEILRERLRKSTTLYDGLLDEPEPPKNSRFSLMFPRRSGSTA